MPDEPGNLAKNRKAYHDFHVLETVEAGIALTGTEVKSCRARGISLQDAYAQVVHGDMVLLNAHISPYAQGNRQNHEPLRARRLLLHQSEIRRLRQQIEQKGLTVVPLACYLKRGRIKVALGLCQGKNKGDKRQAIRRREDQLLIQRAMRSRQ